MTYQDRALSLLHTQRGSGTEHKRAKGIKGRLPEAAHRHRHADPAEPTLTLPYGLHYLTLDCMYGLGLCFPVVIHSLLVPSCYICAMSLCSASGSSCVETGGSGFS